MVHRKCSRTSLIPILPTLFLSIFLFPLTLLSPQWHVEQAAAQSTAFVSNQMNVNAWKAGLGPSAPSLSQLAAASAPGAHLLPPLDALYLVRGPVMGTHAPTGAAAVSVKLPSTSP